MLAVLRSSLREWKATSSISIIDTGTGAGKDSSAAARSPLQSFLAEEIAFTQGPDVLFLGRVGLLYRHAYLSPTDDEKRVTPRSLPDYVVPIVVKSLREDTRGYGQQRVNATLDDRVENAKRNAPERRERLLPPLKRRKF